MSKLATLRQYRYSPAAGNIFGTIWKGIKGAVGGIFGSKTKQVIAQTVLPAAKKAAPYVLPAVGVAAVDALTSSGGSSSGVSGSWSGRRRGRGITARELRGYRKVARLLHQEGMVSRRARGRK